MTLFAQLTPELAATGLTIEIGDVLIGLFGSAAANAHLVAFTGDPKAAPRSVWLGGRAERAFGGLDDLQLFPDQNVFASIAEFSWNNPRRVKSAVTAVALFPLDDVGTKVPRAKVDGLRAKGIVPVMVTETSPGNFQYVYRFATPVSRQGDTSTLALLGAARSCVAAGGWGDPSVVDDVRLIRLPFGINGKAAYGSPTGQQPQVRMAEWNANATVSLGTLVDALGADVTLASPAAVARPPGAAAYSAAMSDPLVQLAARIGLNPRVGTDGRIDARCPNWSEHTGGDDTGFAFLSDGGCKCFHGHCSHLTSQDFEDMMCAVYDAEALSDISAGRVTEEPDGQLRDAAGAVVQRSGRGFLAAARFANAETPTPSQIAAGTAATAAGELLPDWIIKMNTDFAQVRDNPRIVDRRPGPDTLYTLMLPDHFKRFYNEKVQVEPDKPAVPVGVAWLKDPRSSRFDTIAMYEPGTEPPGVLNPYGGLPNSTSLPAVQSARRYDYQPIVAFITEVIASGRREVADYTLDWLAWKVQHPLLKPGVNYVLIGKQGTGKTFFAEIIIDIFGPRLALSVTQERHALGNFNAHLLHKVVVVFDEAFYAKDQKVKGAYKNLTTQDRMVIERKGIDAQQATNHLAIIVTSNELASVPVEPDDRRATVVRVSEHRRQDNAYFAQLSEAWVNGAREAFIEHLRLRDVSKFDPRKPLSTVEKGEVAAATADLATAFWKDLLDEGRAPVQHPRTALDWEAGQIFICDADLYDAFRTFADQRGRRQHLPSPAELHDRIGQLCAGRSARHAKGPRVAGKQGPGGRYYPKLDDCRAELLRAMEGAQPIALADAT